jgi:hypothetical protein
LKRSSCLGPSPKQTDEQRKAADKQLSDDSYRARLHNYLRMNGASAMARDKAERSFRA